MSKTARESWERQAQVLFDMGVLTNADGFALERLARCYAEVEEYRALVEQNGATFTTDSGLIKANPAVAMLADADRRFKSYLVEFGLTPSSRTRVRAADVKEDEPAAQYFA